MTKMNYLHLLRAERALETYRELLSYTKVRAYSLFSAVPFSRK